MSSVQEAVPAGFGHRFAGANANFRVVPPYWITTQTNCPEFSLEFPLKLPEAARAIRLEKNSQIFLAVKDFVEKTSKSASVTSARGEDARMKSMRSTIKDVTIPEFQVTMAKRRLLETDKKSGVKPPTGGLVTVRDVICI